MLITPVIYTQSMAVLTLWIILQVCGPIHLHFPYWPFMGGSGGGQRRDGSGDLCDLWLQGDHLWLKNSPK